MKVTIVVLHTNKFNLQCRLTACPSDCDFAVRVRVIAHSQELQQSAGDGTLFDGIRDCICCCLGLQGVRYLAT
jgi:hypothetical protein